MASDTAEIKREQLFESLYLLNNTSSQQADSQDPIQHISNVDLAQMKQHHPEWHAADPIPELNVYESPERNTHLSAMKYFLALEHNGHDKEAIWHSFETSVDFIHNPKRSNHFLLAFEEDNPDKPIAFICFNLSLMDSWQTEGKNSSRTEFGLCCHLIYIYVMPLWRKRGIAHYLADMMTRAFAQQMQHVGSQMKGSGFRITPILYEGFYAKGAEKLLQHCEHDLEKYLTDERQDLPYHASVSNV